MKKLVIDTHGHILEPADLWENYLESAYKDRAIKFARSENGVEYMLFDNVPSPYSYGVGPFSAGIGKPYEQLCKPGAFSYFDGPPGAYEPNARLSYLDEQGIDKTLIYPSAGLIWGSTVKDIKLNAAYARAYNNWVTDFCAVNPSRLIPVALVPVLDIAEGVKEINRVTKQGAKGVLLFAPPLTKEGFWDKAYDPVWAALQDANIPAIFHPALNEGFFGSQWIATGQEGITDDRYLLYMESCAVVVDVQAAFAQLFQGAVFDRFPKLKVVLLETGAGWIQHAMERMDQKYARVGSRSPLKHLPHEYFMRQCWIGIEADETSVPSLVDRYGDRFLWGTDMPHWDAIPNALNLVRQAIAPLSSDSQNAILGSNATQVFSL